MSGKRLMAAAALLVPLFGWGTIAHAQAFRSGASVTVESGQVVDNTLFAGGQTITIAGTVNGDVYCVGQTIIITGTINGDIFCAGQSVQLSGTVHGGVHVAGQLVTLNAAVDHNLAAIGQNVGVERTSKVGGDTNLGGQNITFDGSTGRDLAIAAQSAVINGMVDRNFVAEVGQLAIGGSAQINGNLNYVSDTLLTRTGGATILGKITRTVPPHHQAAHVQLGALVGGGIGFASYLFTAVLAAAIVLVLLLPSVFQEAATATEKSPLKTALIGLIVGFTLPGAAVVAMLTVIGIPLAILLLLGWFLAVCLSGAFAAYYAGGMILRKRGTNAILIMLVGAAVLLVAYFLPILGGLVMIGAGCLGLGMIAQQVRRLPKPRYSVRP